MTMPNTSMKKKFLITEISKHLLYALLPVVFYACHDTRSFENARKVKCGMTINEIEKSMGRPLTYQYINDSTESRGYVYDNSGNGIDKRLEVTYENGISTGIKDCW